MLLVIKENEPGVASCMCVLNRSLNGDFASLRQCSAMRATPVLIDLNALTLCLEKEWVSPSFCGCMFWNVTIVVLGHGVVGKVWPKWPLSAAEMAAPWRLDWARG